MENALIAIDDIEELRSYERHRDQTKADMIRTRALRRLELGDIMSLAFENRQTVLYQIQEMARAERMLSDEQIEEEIRAYSTLIPKPGQLVGTLFIELSTKSDLMHWLPILPGIETHLILEVGDESFRSYPEEEHASQLTRSDITPSVHYIKFDLSSMATQAFGEVPVTLKVDHPNYKVSCQLSQELKASLVQDWNARS